MLNPDIASLDELGRELGRLQRLGGGPRRRPNVVDDEVSQVGEEK